MKHERIGSHQNEIPVPHLSDQETEARVFRSLEAQQQAMKEEQEGRIIIMQYPETRTLHQRFTAWWYLRFQCKNDAQVIEPVRNIKEPVWPGHWATTKYL